MDAQALVSTATGRCWRCWAAPPSGRSPPGTEPRGSRCTPGGARFEQEGMPGVADRSRRPRSSRHWRAADLGALICELRRKHPRWGARRLVHELGRRGCSGCRAGRRCIGC